MAVVADEEYRARILAECTARQMPPTGWDDEDYDLSPRNYWEMG